MNADNISYVSNQFSLIDLFKISDLNLFPWISTPLFESLYFDSDVFFMEEEDDIDMNLYTDKLKNELFCFNNTNEYIKELDKYLEQGNFYKREKKKTTEIKFFILGGNLQTLTCF